MKYGIWNSIKQEFQFGIKEDSKSKAWKQLFKKIGHDSKKDRFTVRRMPEDIVKIVNDNFWDLI